MRIRSRKHLRLHQVVQVVGVLIPIAIVGTIAGIAANFYNEIPKFGYSDDLRPDPDDFQDVNYTRLSQMAQDYEQRFEDWHIPLGFVVSTEFTDQNLTILDRYHFSDNGALWSGTALVTFTAKYQAAINEGNEAMKNDSLGVMDLLVKGMAMMLKVPNGGLGPQFGATVARGFAHYNNISSVPGCNYLFVMSDPKMYNGTDGTQMGGEDYSQWRWSDFTSNDEYGGFYMGIGIAYKYIKDNGGTSPLELKIKNTLELMIDQCCAGMLRANFLGIGGFGGPTGVDQKMRLFSGATWTLVVLKMGALAFPEKYEDLYYHYALEEGYAYYTLEGGTHEIVANYYAYNFGIDMVFANLMMEDHPALHTLYLENFKRSLWYCVRYHRNPYFNSMYLAAHKFGPAEDQLLFELDVEDQLMEFDVYHFPDVYLQLSRPPQPPYVNFTLSEYKDYFENTPLGNFLAPIFMEFNLDQLRWNRPLTVKMKPSSILMWDRNPFDIVPEKYYNGNDNLLKEEPGISFLAPYWIGRGFSNYIKENGTRV
ncbi:MAG: hypothetical protein ACFFCS_07205 [Candidatus Hodarchaeota archaeon]